MLPVQITIRGIPASPALESHIRKRAEKLNQYFDRINSCRIVLEMSKKHQHQGRLYNMRIDIKVPGKELVVTHKLNEDVYVAIRDAFDAIVRQLESYSRKIHGLVKTHPEVTHGRVARMLTDEGYGFIEGMDGNEYYFSVTNVHFPRFEQLSIGDTVEYVAEPLNDGWQAQHVVKERSS